MIRLIRYGIQMFFVCIFIFSCQKTEKGVSFSMDPQELVQFFNTEGGERIILITSNKELHPIVSDSSWCKAEIWTNREEKKIVLTVLNNRDVKPRNTNLLLFSGDKELARIKIAQLGH
ncbi:MAG: BACON domain-containing protein, partial [Bacteroidales bacterium]|nr:BACON domain-containing protein [Bacteroidales bacterium]